MKISFKTGVIILVIVIVVYQLAVSIYEKKSKGAESIVETESPQILEDTTKRLRAVVPNFNDVPGLITSLEQLNIGKFSEWKFRDFDYLANTPYYEIGNGAPLANNVAIYIEGPTENFVEEVKVILNVNNKAQEKLAQNKFREVIKSCYEAVGLKPSSGLLNSIGKTTFNASNEKYSEELKLIESNISTWKFILKTEAN